MKNLFRSLAGCGLAKIHIAEVHSSMRKSSQLIGKNRVALSRVTLAAMAACAVGLVAVPNEAHAAAPTTTTYTYTTGTTNLNGGATNAMVSTGNLVDDNQANVDYGVVSNIVLTRLGPALAACALAGTIIVAAKGGLRLVQGWLGHSL